MAWNLLCSSAELADSEAREFCVAGRVIALFRHQSTFYAVDGICAHQGGPLAKGQLDGNCVTCPWHGWQYDIASGKNVLTGKQMLECFAIEVRDSQVWIDI